MKRSRYVHTFLRMSVSSWCSFFIKNESRYTNIHIDIYVFYMYIHIHTEH